MSDNIRLIKEPIDMLTRKRSNKSYFQRLADRWQKFWKKLGLMFVHTPEHQRIVWPWQKRDPSGALTNDELREATARAAAEKAQELADLKMKMLATRMARVISDTLANYGVNHWLKRERADRRDVERDRRGRAKKQREQKIRFRTPFYYNDSAIFYPIDTRPGRFPREIGPDDLRDPQAIELCSINAGKIITTEARHDRGFWYVLNLDTSVRQIPKHVKLSDMLKTRSASLPPFSWPVGISTNGEAVWSSLISDVNILMAGAPGEGKSNELNVLICGLIGRHTPDELGLVFVDLKGGVEFKGFYGALPHVMPLPQLKYSKPKKKDDDELPPPEDEAEEKLRELVSVTATGRTIAGIITERRDVVGALAWSVREIERRFGVLERAGVKDLASFNATHPEQRMKRILLVVDEWADVFTDEEVGKASERLLRSGANRGRAAGVHYVVCTQSPNAEILSQALRNAFKTRLVFRVGDQYLSQALVNDYSAKMLEVPGRAIYISGRLRKEIQAPYISDQMIRDFVLAAQMQQPMDAPAGVAHDVTYDEIFRWALDHAEGHLVSEEIHAAFKERGLTRKEAGSVWRAWEGRDVWVRDALYHVRPPNFQLKLPPRLLPSDTPLQTGKKLLPPPTTTEAPNANQPAIHQRL